MRTKKELNTEFLSYEEILRYLTRLAAVVINPVRNKSERAFTTPKDTKTQLKKNIYQPSTVFRFEVSRMISRTVSDRPFVMLVNNKNEIFLVEEEQAKDIIIGSIVLCERDRFGYIRLIHKSFVC